MVVRCVKGFGAGPIDLALPVREARTGAGHLNPGSADMSIVLTRSGSVALLSRFAGPRARHGFPCWPSASGEHAPLRTLQ